MFHVLFISQENSLVGDLTPDNSCCQTTAQFAVIVCLLLIITVNVVIMLSSTARGLG